VDLLADSAQAVMPYGGRWAEMVNAWNPRFPEACTDCAQRLPALIDTHYFVLSGTLAHPTGASTSLPMAFPASRVSCASASPATVQGT
jgi:hypothetical protein